MNKDEHKKYIVVGVAIGIEAISFIVGFIFMILSKHYPSNQMLKIAGLSFVLVVLVAFLFLVVYLTFFWSWSGFFNYCMDGGMKRIDTLNYRQLRRNYLIIRLSPIIHIIFYASFLLLFFYTRDYSIIFALLLGLLGGLAVRPRTKMIRECYEIKLKIKKGKKIKSK